MVNTEIYLGSGASVTFVPEIDIYLKPHQTPSTAIDAATSTILTPHGDFTGNFSLVVDLYVGCVLDFYDNGTKTTSHRITANASNSITFHPALAATIVPANDYFHIRGYGAPCPATADGAKRLNADNWLGLVESLTFPSLEVEFKEQNLFVGGSRNFTHQYKGIETTGSADIGVVANHGAWLYYFLGKCSGISASYEAGPVNPASDFAGAASSENKYYLNPTVTETGPLFFRSINNVMTPPVLVGIEIRTDLDQITEPTVGGDGLIDDAITYTFTEQEGDDLPSFTLEQSYSKLPASNTYRTTGDAAANEDLNFVLIATGNRVNSLTITANEKEEVKMTVNTMARKVHSLLKGETYDARRGVTDNRAFKNYSDVDTFLEPFFFSSGSISMFGQNFLRITSLSIVMNNTLTEKRYVGIGSRSIQDHVPAQRTYEITFTALVTDDLIYNELINGAETSGSLIDIIFDKSNGEQIRLKFDDYYLTTNTWPIPDDKGPVAVDATVKARTLNSCTVKTHWILQG